MKREVNPSSDEEVRELYDESADSYAEMMDREIELPLYVDTLERLSKRIENLPGALIDTSCGTGHMLSLYSERFDRKRPLIGIDLSTRMVAIATRRFGPSAEIKEGDMRDLSSVAVGSAAALINFFSIHHLDADSVCVALREWHRILKSGGQLVVAAWEGVGAIDYGEFSNVVALRFTAEELLSSVQSSGFLVTRCVVEPVDGMEMDAIYLEATKG